MRQLKARILMMIGIICETIAYGQSNLEDGRPFLEKDIHSVADYWASADVFDDGTRDEIKQLIDANNSDELSERFYRDLEFGTGGLRGILGAGTNRMNIYNVRKASHALALYIKEKIPADVEKRVAVSYDSRRYSREFAEATAEVMAGHGIRCYITKELRPTPMLSYMVRHFACQGGVCVTASHNPPDYNGYKVYWQTGGQIVPPHDKGIIALYQNCRDYDEIPVTPFKKGLESGLIKEVGEEFDEIYFEKVASLATYKQTAPLKIVYTPLHGTGAYPVVSCLKRFGFDDVLLVEEQAKPNGDFPTVAYPNPEDPDALAMAIALAKKEDADLVLASDPDADRIGIAFKENGSYTMLNGNQIGSLLVDYVLSSSKASGRLPENPLVIKTVVTTDLQTDIARYYGAECLETLTGFKWICQLIEDIETGAVKPHRNYVCGGEESFGFLAGHFVRDKDAVSASCIAAEMVSYYKSQGKTLTQVLDSIFKRHGVYQESLKTVTLPGRQGVEKISAIMGQLRKDPPSVIDGTKVTKFKDLLNSKAYEMSSAGFVDAGAITLPSSNVLQFELEDGSKISARPSGTEPKIKFYFSVKAAVSNDLTNAEFDKVKTTCKNRLASLEKALASLMES